MTDAVKELKSGKGENTVTKEGNTVLYKFEPEIITEISSSRIECKTDAIHDLPSFLHNDGKLLISGVRPLEIFRVVCEKKDVSSYYITTQRGVKPSQMMDFLEDIEKNYAVKYLLGRVPNRYLDILSKTENLFALDSRYGMAVGVRRLLEDFIVENYAVLIFYPETKYGHKFNKKQLDRLRKKHAGRIIALYSPKAQTDLRGMRKPLDRTYLDPATRALSTNSKLQAALLSPSRFDSMYRLYNLVSQFIHGRGGEPSEGELRDGLMLVMESCKEYITKGIGWGIL